MRTAKKPSFLGVRKSALGILGGGPNVGRGVGVSLGVASGNNGVSVGVKVTGVLVVVAKRSRVGKGVTVGAGVNV
jgi:hypothetical protein